MDRSLAITLGIAVFAHAIAFALVRPLRHHAAPAVVESSQTDVIELTDEPIAPSAPTVAAPADLNTEAKVAVASKNVGSIKAKDAVAIAVPGAAAPSAPIEIVAPSAASGSEPSQTSPSKIPSLINLDSPGSHAVIWPTSGGSGDGVLSKEAAAAKKLDAQLKASLDAHDTATGSGFGGPVVSAAHSAAGSATTLGWATFDVTTDALGSVTTVRVVDFGGGGDSKSWQGVAKDIHANLGKTKLRVPNGAGGVSVRIRIDASMKFPSGKTTYALPSVGPGSAGIEFDVSDIGQKKKRQVHVQIVNESRI